MIKYKPIFFSLDLDVRFIFHFFCCCSSHHNEFHVSIFSSYPHSIGSIQHDVPLCPRIHIFCCCFCSISMIVKFPLFFLLFRVITIFYGIPPRSNWIFSFNIVFYFRFLFYGFFFWSFITLHFCIVVVC